MTIDQPSRDDVDKAIRRAITALAGLGSIERLHPLDQIAVGQAAAKFADTVTAAVRRSRSTARRGRRGTQRGRRQPASVHNTEGTPA